MDAWVSGLAEYGHAWQLLLPPPYTKTPINLLTTTIRKHYKLFLDAAAEGSWSTVGAVEHKLEYTDVYNLFLEHFEGKFSGKMLVVAVKKGDIFAHQHTYCSAVCDIA